VFAYPLSDALIWGTTLVALLTLFEAARRARWSGSLFEHTVWALATAAVLLGQHMGISLDSGLQVQYLGSAFLALLVGYPRALMSMAAVLLLAPLLQSPAAGPAALDSLNTWGLRVLVCAVMPVWAMWAIVQACKRLLPRNLFVFLLGCGLFGLLAAYVLQLLASATLYASLAPQPPRDFLEAFLPYALLLASGEAWLEGMIVTVLVVYVPGAVKLFDEGWYLRRLPSLPP